MATEGTESISSSSDGDDSSDDGEFTFGMDVFLMPQSSIAHSLILFWLSSCNFGFTKLSDLSHFPGVQASIPKGDHAATAFFFFNHYAMKSYDAPKTKIPQKNHEEWLVKEVTDKMSSHPNLGKIAGTGRFDHHLQVRKKVFAEYKIKGTQQFDVM